MGKITQLSGVAHNLADSFVSVTNRDFLNNIESLPLKKIVIRIDLLKEKIDPEDLMSQTIVEAIAKYKKWFLSEIGKLEINKKEIEKVTIKINYKPKKSGRMYICNVIIIAKGKKYSQKGISSCA